MSNEESMDSNLDSDSITTEIANDKEFAIVYEKVKNKYWLLILFKLFYLSRIYIFVNYFPKSHSISSNLWIQNI